MRIKEDSAIAKAFIAMGKAMGVIETPKALTLTDVTGVEIEIEREEGEPQVGDATSAADGEYILEDGRTLVVKEGVITEIKTEEETTEEVEETPAAAEDTEEADKVTELEAEIEELKKQLEEAKKENKTEEEAEALAFIAENGGIQALKAKAVGNWKPLQRTGIDKAEKEDKTQAMIEARLKAVKESRKKK